MDICKTVRIQPTHESQGAFVEINEADFDAKVHKLYEDERDHFDHEDGGLTKPEIHADLEAMGVEFDPRAKKADLLALRNAARAERDQAAAE